MGGLEQEQKGCYLSGNSWEKMPYETRWNILQTFLKPTLILSVMYPSSWPGIKVYIKKENLKTHKKTTKELGQTNADSVMLVWN